MTTSFTPVSSYTVPSGNVAASPSPGSIGNGWTDVSGNIWSIVNGQLSSVPNNGNAWNQSVLAREGLPDQNLDQQTSINYTVGTAGYSTYAMFRLSFPTASTSTCYMIGVNNNNGSIVGFYVNNGNLTQLSNNVASGTQTTPTPGASYAFTANCVQTNASTTTITGSLISGSTTVYQVAWTDTTQAYLQNITGFQGIFNHGTGSTTNFISSISTSTDIIMSNSPASVFSPYNWANGLGGEGTSQSWNAGAYARFYVSGTTAVTILFDPTVQTAYYTYSIDGGLNVAQALVPASGQVAVTLPTTGAHVVTVRLYSIPQAAGRWNRSLYMGLVGLQLGAGGQASNTASNSKNMLIIGDSITEGIFANNGSDGNPYDYSYLIGEAFYKEGYEYGIVACGSQGYTCTGTGSVPNLYTIGSDSASSWDKVDASTSRLVNGYLNPLPNVIIDNMGANDGINNHTGAALTPTLVAQMQAFWTALRAASPGALILKVIPFGGYARADINTAAAAYVAATGDPLFAVLDLAIDSRMTSASNAYCYTGGGVHPGVWGHANIASLLLGMIQSQGGIVNQTSFINAGTKYSILSAPGAQGNPTGEYFVQDLNLNKSYYVAPLTLPGLGV